MNLFVFLYFCLAVFPAAPDRFSFLTAALRFLVFFFLASAVLASSNSGQSLEAIFDEPKVSQMASHRSKYGYKD